MNKLASPLKQYSKLAGVFFLGVLGGFFLFAFAYLVVTSPGDNITLVESGFRTGVKGERFLIGTLRNNTDDTYAFVQADISLMDEEGSIVRDTFVTTRHLDAGKTWRFEVPLRGDEATRAVLDGQCGRQYNFHGEAAIPPDGFSTSHRGGTRSSSTAALTHRK